MTFIEAGVVRAAGLFEAKICFGERSGCLLFTFLVAFH